MRTRSLGKPAEYSLGGGKINTLGSHDTAQLP
jgi:hypothetical protein